MNSYIIRRVRYENGGYSPAPTDAAIFVQAPSPKEALAKIADSSRVTGAVGYSRVRVWTIQSGDTVDTSMLLSRDYSVFTRSVVQSISLVKS